MPMQLQILKGNDIGKLMALDGGQRIRVGRSPLVEYSCPDETRLAGIHFSIESLPDRIQLTVAEGIDPIAVNGILTSQCDLKEGDTIECGNTIFGIVSTAPTSDETTEASTPDLNQVPTASAPRIKPIDEPTTDLSEIISTVEITCEARRLIEPNESISFNIDRLRSSGFTSDASTLYVRSLSKHAAVAWGIEYLEAAAQKGPIAYDERSLRSAKAWVDAPNEATRREAEAAAATANYADPAAFLAQAAFWSGGSIGPATSPAETPTQDHLPFVAIIAALKMLG